MVHHGEAELRVEGAPRQVDGAGDQQQDHEDADDDGDPGSYPAYPPEPTPSNKAVSAGTDVFNHSDQVPGAASSLSKALL